MARLPIVGRIIVAGLMANNQFHLVRRRAAALSFPPVFYPAYETTGPTQARVETVKAEPVTDMVAKLMAVHARHPTSASNPFRFWTVNDYQAAYSTGKCTPVDVARAIIAAVRGSHAASTLCAIVELHGDDLLAQATASTQRHASRHSLGERLWT